MRRDIQILLYKLLVLYSQLQVDVEFKVSVYILTCHENGSGILGVVTDVGGVYFLDTIRFNDMLSDQSLFVPEPDQTSKLIRVASAPASECDQKLLHLVIALGKANTHKRRRIAF